MVEIVKNIQGKRKKKYIYKKSISNNVLESKKSSLYHFSCSYIHLQNMDFYKSSNLDCMEILWAEMVCDGRMYNKWSSTKKLVKLECQHKMERQHNKWLENFTPASTKVTKNKSTHN